jgi:hypothetical protein
VTGLNWRRRELARAWRGKRSPDGPDQFIFLALRLLAYGGDVWGSWSIAGWSSYADGAFNVGAFNLAILGVKGLMTIVACLSPPTEPRKLLQLKLAVTGRESVRTARLARFFL